MRKKRYIFRRFMTFMFYFSIMFLLAFSVSITKLKSDDDIAHIFGFGILTVPVNSDVDAKQDDVLIVKLLNAQEKRNLNEEDTISLYNLQLNAFTKHTIKDIHEYDGEIYYTTEPELSVENLTLVSAQDVSSLEVTTIKGIGNVLNFLLTPKGFALGILLPVIIIWIIESMVLVTHLLKYHQKKLEKNFIAQAKIKSQEVEDEFEVIRKQLLKNFNLE